MNRLTSLVEFFVVSFTNVVVGMGLGVAMSWSMTAQIERQYQVSFFETGAIAGGVIALLAGDLSYYAILCKRVTYRQASIVVAVVGLSGIASAYLLHVLTNTGGWLSMFVALAPSFSAPSN